MPEVSYLPDPKGTFTASREYACDCPGGSGATQIYSGAAPPAAPDDPASPAIFYPDGGGPIQQWDVVGQAWV